MKTTIAEFCAELSQALFPLAEALGDTVEATDDLTDTSAAGVVQDLASARHRLDALINKVQGQEAYLLLFGPLKSGKSTLINAISGGYVSEVTSLPAYPCMVYLKYADESSYSVIRYSGKREQIDSAEGLMSLLEQSHRTLSERIRAMEDFGEAFDPAVHLPSAIRRVQVGMPVENLRELGTVLVDTPGLYSKMKFGYDYMTQEFRDSAACAVFVVKTDNLFLEQVFSDFNDLLDQFSRVFVVVNIDHSKSDLQPDGSLEPSLESRDPDQIVKAFEVLTMSAPLRRAAESGRLHIYPIDLRSAAAKRLSADPAVEQGNTESDRFDEFLSDLMNYLNSTDYLLEFMSDSIRQSAKLSAEVARLCQTDIAQGLEDEKERLQQELSSLDRLASTADTTAMTNWMAQLAPVSERFDGELDAAREQAMSSLDTRAEELAQEWECSDQSLESLRAQGKALLQSSLDGFRTQAAKSTAEIHDSVDKTSTMPEVMLERLAALRIDPASCRPQPPALDAYAGPDAPALDEIPVHRSLADRMLFRTENAVRQRLLEPAEEAVPAAVKQKRLRGAADYIRTTLNDAMTETLDKVGQQARAEVERYLSGVAEATDDAVATRQRQLAEAMAEFRERLQGLDKAREVLARLGHVAAEIESSISSMDEKHGERVKLARGEGREEAAP